MSADWLNPIVVKELRQGLKSRLFTGMFLTLQGVMFMCMMIYVLSDKPGGDMEFINGMFWFLLGVLVVLVIPIRAFQSIHEEQKNNTLEMLYLTRMSSWKIAFGKWLALVIQQWLLVTAVLPYLVLRYFLGAINVADDLLTLSLMVVTGMLLISAGIGFSGWKSKLVRGLLIGGVAMSFYVIPIALFGLSRSGLNFSSSPVVWIATLIGLVLLMLFFIEYGASLIAPPAENHAKRKRILALLIIGLYMIVLVIEKSAPLVFLGLLFIIPICIDSLCEPFHLVPSLYRSSRRHFWVVRLIRRLFYPGWPSGFLFVTIVLMIWSTSVILFGPGEHRIVLFLTSLLGTLFLPLAIVAVVRPATAHYMSGYLVILFITFIVSMVLMVFEAVSRSGFNFLSGFLPMSTLIMSISRKTASDQILSTAVITAICVLIIVIKMAKPWRDIIALEKSDS